MKKKLYTIAVLLAFAIAITSCLSNSEEVEITTYDDTAMSSFSLSAVNRYVHTTSKSGGDSVYLSKLAVAKYPFAIDQYQRKIYNSDSLPADCDLKHILVTATATSYSGTIAVKSATSDSLSYYSGTDSLDFSTIREFRVYNNTGDKYRAYQVQVNVKKQASSKMGWEQMPAGTVMPTTPMAGWDFIYNSAGNGFMASQDNWITSFEETFDEDIRLLPSSASASFACWKLGNGLSYALLVGNSDAQDKYAVVWRKVIDNDNPTSSSWVYIPVEVNNSYALPKLGGKDSRYYLLPYINGSVLAIDDNGNIYQSRDQGITWKTSSTLQSPTSRVLKASTDGNGGIWLWTRDSDDESDPGVVWYGKAGEE